MAGFLRVVRSLALLLARVGLGGILMLHGWRRWQQQGIDSQIAYLKTFATPFATYAAWGGTIIELVGGIFLIVGALVPLVAAVIVAEQVLIVAYTSWYKGWSLTTPQGTHAAWAGGWEYSVVLGLLALLFVVYGGGDVAIDRLFRRKKKIDDSEDEPQSEQPQRLNRQLGGSTTRPTGPSSPNPATGSSKPATGNTSGVGSGTSGSSTAATPATDSTVSSGSNSTTDTLIRPLS